MTDCSTSLLECPACAFSRLREGEKDRVMTKKDKE